MEVRLLESRRSGIRAGVPVLAVLLSLVPLQAQALLNQRPNLVPMKPFDIAVGVVGDSIGQDLDSAPRAIEFSITTVNRGAYAIELLGVPTTADEALGSPQRPAQQCVLWGSRACLMHEEVGRFVWHPEHLHWHFEDYALYELRRVRDQQPDMSPQGLVAPGRKASFCLLDMERRETPASEDPLAGVGLYSDCSENLQGISPGWADTYHRGIPGQEIALGNTLDGVYALVVTIDPERHLLESNEDDNSAFTIVEILDGGREAREIA